MLKQQKQTKKYFEKKAYAWSRSAKHDSAGIINTIYQRNQYVFEQIKKNKLKKHLDVACGSGDLAFLSSKITKHTLGVDFSKKMIEIARKKYKNKNLNFQCSSIFDFKSKNFFDCISANGFIEYLSINEIKKFFKFSHSKLEKKGLLIFGSRNRLFNLFSLNQFSKLEKTKKSFHNFFEESINLTSLNLQEFLKLKKPKFESVNFKQPETGGVKVSLRHQFSPLQISNILTKFKLKIIDIHPINYHPVPVSVFNDDINYKLISKYIYNIKNKNKLPFVPFSSTFMVSAIKK
jgi:2-polyprenyl-3-methyl-5-hydroxy-6-metoxy-1,4-benzoquinol methylase